MRENDVEEWKRVHPVQEHLGRKGAVRQRPGKEWPDKDANPFIRKRFKHLEESGKLVRIGERVWLLRD